MCDMERRLPKGWNIITESSYKAMEKSRNVFDIYRHESDVKNII